MTAWRKALDNVGADRILDAVERQHSSLDNPGFCIECGTDQDDVEPDACAYRCDSCGAMAVYGAEELLIMVAS